MRAIERTSGAPKGLRSLGSRCEHLQIFQRFAHYTRICKSAVSFVTRSLRSFIKQSASMFAIPTKSFDGLGPLEQGLALAFDISLSAFHH